MTSPSDASLRAADDPLPGSDAALLWESWLEGWIREALEAERTGLIEPCRSRSLRFSGLFGIDAEALAKRNGWKFERGVFYHCWYAPPEPEKASWGSGGLTEPTKRRRRR